MPIYEYRCTQCDTLFEFLARGDSAPACPDCGATAVEKQFSTFAAHAGGGEGIPPCRRDGPGCDLGKCGSGRCGLE
jgi:putative FmdB family regulatory protein